MSSTGLTHLVVGLVNREMRKPRQAKENLVYLTPVLLVVGMVCTALFLIPGLILPLCTGSWETWPFLCLAAMSATLIVAYINCRIWYTEEEFTVRYFLGYRRTFSYREIESIQGWNRDVKLKVRGCTVRVDEAAVGKQEFLKTCKKQYRIAHGGKAIPEVKKSKWDPFNGHVDNPGEFMVMFLVLVLFMPVLTIVLWFVEEPTPMEELIFVTAAVEAASVEDHDLILRIDGQDLEVWGFESTLSDVEAFQTICESGEELTAGYRIVTNDEDEVTGLCAEYIADGSGTVWITPQRAKEYRFETTAVVFALVELLMLAVSGAYIYVGRNPHKFSKKFVRLFFKDGYIH